MKYRLEHPALTKPVDIETEVSLEDLIISKPVNQGLFDVKIKGIKKKIGIDFIKACIITEIEEKKKVENPLNYVSVKTGPRTSKHRY